MNAFVRPAKHMLVAIAAIDVTHTLRPYNAEVVAELAQSIRTIGLQTPLTCIVRDGRHILVAGRHRLEALRAIGCEEAPVRVVDFNDVEAQLWRLSENLHRAELTKLQYDKQVVEYAELLKVKMGGETSAPHSTGESPAAKLTAVRQVAAEYGKIVAPQISNRLAARELNVPERTIRRAYQTASLAPEAQQAAERAGLDDNRSALLRAAKKPSPEERVAEIERLAERKTSAAEPLSGEIATSPKQGAKPLRDLTNISGGALARWIKITTPNDRPHVIRVLRTAATILEHEACSAANDDDEPLSA